MIGDKSNHVATIHFAQMLYVWPFIAFFGWPVLLQPATAMLRTPYHHHFRHSTFPYRSSSQLVLLGAVFCCILLVIHLNTQIHPFILADNRHYTFYIFRYFFRRNVFQKYFWAPIYLVSGYTSIIALGATPISWVVIWLLASTLSLVTAPLVEPRYFIMPYVLWRIQVALGNKVQKRYLLLELAWLLLVNFLTIYLFLNNPFSWSQEPGTLQRFMW